MNRLVALVVGTIVAAAPLAGQGLVGAIGFSAGSARSRSQLGSTEEVLSGTVVGGEGRVGIGRVTLDFMYLQGALRPDTGSAESRDYVEGDALLSVATVPGLTVRMGPHARAYISSNGTQRWLFWTARLRGERALIAPAVSGFVELWAAWSGDVNVSEEFGSARGGLVGMSVRPPGSLFYGRLTYGIEHAKMGGGARLETVEGVSLLVGFGRR